MYIRKSSKPNYTRRFKKLCWTKTISKCFIWAVVVFYNDNLFVYDLIFTQLYVRFYYRLFSNVCCWLFWYMAFISIWWCIKWIHSRCGTVIRKKYEQRPIWNQRVTESRIVAEAQRQGGKLHCCDLFNPFQVEQITTT